MVQRVHTFRRVCVCVCIHVVLFHKQQVSKENFESSEGGGALCLAKRERDIYTKPSGIINFEENRNREQFTRTHQQAEDEAN